ncbi:DUF3833 domain-containing protein [Oceanomicrobium pacificus]|uniref:DUF3833 family protein n=1 Tax=Oceanomicrobium pacificus TaxID=2692916 RepID=A0A6B0TYC4_9RHOB|nr:DUF3833 domain-containing protein [Oceanomicrobium pacificus]MXU66003.1 DUF3833 family protein [Oceanomicrobium pacificus]
MTARILTLLLLLGLAACGRPDLTASRDVRPAFDLVDYFEGQTWAWGQFQDRLGRIRARFQVRIDGDWDGRTLTLDETFLYDDGSTEKRIWRLQRAPDGRWVGQADGVVGGATGEVSGNTFNWVYTIDLPVGDGETLRVGFDDWLWLQPSGGLINRAYVSRFGVTVGEVLIFFAKDNSTDEMRRAFANAGL